MSVSWVQTIPQWSGNGAAAPSNPFTATANDSLVVFSGDFSSSTSILTYSGTGTGTWSQFNPPGNLGDINANTVGAAINILCGAGSQTILVDGTGHANIGWGFEYSGVSTASASGTSNNAPGTTISGTAVTVPTGSLLVAICINTGTTGALNLSASPTGTNRGLGTTDLFALSYCITEYAGIGGLITPTFTTSIGTDVFDVIQISLNAFNSATLAWLT